MPEKSDYICDPLRASSMGIYVNSIIKIFFFCVLILFLSPFSVSASDSQEILKQSIIAWNLEQHKKSLSDNSYKGEEGVLRLRPDVARSFGLKLPEYEDYEAAVRIFEDAEEILDRIIKEISSDRRTQLSREEIGEIGKLALSHNHAVEKARALLASYRSGIKKASDDRLDRPNCLKLMEVLIEESMKACSYNLRDGLASFYNRCQGMNDSDGPLNTRNVRFVNHIFNEFTERASGQDLKLFDMERGGEANGLHGKDDWQRALGRNESRYADFLNDILGSDDKGHYPVDPLLFMALMRRESNFDSKAVSYVGAAGLTQIMPMTGKGLGMKHIFMPDYFNEAQTSFSKERRLRKKAVNLILGITDKNKESHATLARKYMLDSLEFAGTRRNLFHRYKKELLKDGTDDRLDPRKAIDFGFRYFSRMMRIQDGDISLALASYNAGPKRVAQYEGIPPYKETITFRNRVLRYYRDYLHSLSR